MTKHAFSKVFGTGTKQYITPRKPLVKICSDPYDHHRSHFDPTVTTFDVEGASITFFRSFGNHHGHQCLNPKPMIGNTYRTSQLATYLKKNVVIKQKRKTEIMFDGVDIVVCRIPSHTAKLLQSVTLILPVPVKYWHLCFYVAGGRCKH